jgi:murein DD-endopeptidase MepM/ murein hydrolase activator NlpD
MARRIGQPPRRRSPVLALVIGLFVIVGLIGLVVLFARGGGSPGRQSTSGSPSPSIAYEGQAGASSSTPSAPARASSSPGAPRGSSFSSAASPSFPAPQPTSAQTSPGQTQSPSLPPTPGTNAAPQSASDFDLRSQVIDIGFPLRADAAYHYRDNWLERRAGPPHSYNHAKVGPGGELVRLHDGIDIYGPQGEPVLAPFDGTVIDPATKWTPWEPDRYGLTVVITSDEPNTSGYMAVLVHLDNVWVDTGQHVTRGQVIGTLGNTGDAKEVKPQLHFELRAPFMLDWSALGEDRLVDAFNPYPSLVAADPHS